MDLEALRPALGLELTLCESLVGTHVNNVIIFYVSSFIFEYGGIRGKRELLERYHGFSLREVMRRDLLLFTLLMEERSLTLA